MQMYFRIVKGNSFILWKTIVRFLVILVGIYETAERCCCLSGIYHEQFKFVPYVQHQIKIYEVIIYFMFADIYLTYVKCFVNEVTYKALGAQC